jgi:hypothetical protein
MAEAQMRPEMRPVCEVRITSKGPRFFRGEDGAVMFELQLDSRCKIGPRPMKSDDKRQHPAAWQAFTGQAKAEPMERTIEAADHPAAKAQHDADKAERQRRMDARRGGGL